MMGSAEHRLTFGDVRHGWVGLLFIAIFWPLNWLLPRDLHATAYFFFPLWFGYILCVDAIVFLRAGDSMLVRSPRNFALLFVASAPAWWIFEVINWRTENWEYLGSESFKFLEYHILSTISFSTVMPAVFETAELMATFRWTEHFAKGPSLKISPMFLRGSIALGIIWFVLALVWPRFFYPLVWGALFLIIEPVNVFLGRDGLYQKLRAGDWRLVVWLSLGSLVCGFFWEMWNYFSYPKWIYHTPGADFMHVFEMPLLGYIGYLPFAWELYAMASLLVPTAAPFRK